MLRWFTVLAAVVACADNERPPADGGATAEIAAVDTSTGTPVTDLVFGDTATGQSSTATQHVENHGALATGPIAVGVSGDFALDAAGTTCQGLALGPAEGCDVVVVFRPTVVGLRSGSLVITSDPGGSLSIALAGAGVAAMLQLDPLVAELGEIDVGASASTTVHVTNTAGMTAPLQNLHVTGAAFSVSSMTCGGTLAAGATCDVSITFAPTALGAVDGSLVVSSDGNDYAAQLHGTGTSELTVILSGNGSGTVTSAPVGINCGSTCTAPFAASVQLTAVAATASSFAGWSDPSCSGSTCTVALTTVPRSITASFTVGDVFLSPGVFDFGSVDTTSGPFGTLQLINNTVAVVGIDSIAMTGPFAIAQTTCGIALGAGASCDVRVRFLSRTVGASAGTLDVTVDGQHHVSQLTGTGELPITVIVQGGGSVSSSPAGIDCGASCTGLFSGNVILTAVPTAGNMFGTWSTCGTSATCIVGPGDSVTATFVPSGAPSLAVVFGGDATGELRVFDVTQGTQLAMCTGSCSVPLTSGDTIEVWGATISNFDGLSGACTATGNTSHCQFLALGAVTLTATFDKAPAQRWTRFITQSSQSFQLAFDFAGNLLVIQSNAITQLTSSDGSLGWSQQLQVDSFVVASNGVYVASAGNLVFLDTNGVAQASNAFAGTLQFLAPNGDLIGTNPSTGATTEWDSNGVVVRSLTIGPVNGIDSTGTFYASKSTTADEGGEQVTRSAAGRWAFDGTPLSDIPEVTPPTANAGCSGFAVGGDHIVGYACGHRIPMTGLFGWESHAPDGTLEVSSGTTTTASDIVPGAATPAGPNIAFYNIPDSVTVNHGVGVAFGWMTHDVGGWTSHGAVRNDLGDGIEGVVAVTPTTIVGGPHGEVALFGTYQGLFNMVTQQKSGGPFIQTFYP